MTRSFSLALSRSLSLSLSFSVPLFLPLSSFSSLLQFRSTCGIHRDYGHLDFRPPVNVNTSNPPPTSSLQFQVIIFYERTLNISRILPTFNFVTRMIAAIPKVVYRRT